MKKVLIVLGLGAFFALAPIQVVVTADAVVVTQSEAKAQVLPPPGCPPFCPPGPPAASGSPNSGASGGQYAAWGIIAVATYYAVLNPRRGSDSIFANTFYGEWACARRDKRSKCDTFVRLSLREQNRLRRAAGLPPH